MKIDYIDFLEKIILDSKICHTAKDILKVAGD
jgi:hypothetical protein